MLYLGEWKEKGGRFAHTNIMIKLYSVQRKEPGIWRMEMLWEEVFLHGEAMIGFISDFI